MSTLRGNERVYIRNLDTPYFREKNTISFNLAWREPESPHVQLKTASWMSTLRGNERVYIRNIDTPYFRK
ncbi:hypothetical protein [Pontibacter sp. G13]|uniref:hypothetical protein n=1 Tax=Pontibacter sp. G13 TaxID=3074898 RepID=UPI00288B888E|nr:hypothetical protein [Pontibacter sp. G13]WNJ16884.1 hypothetical protein RJD25_18625 [Pontibacter sp. G13]